MLWSLGIGHLLVALKLLIHGRQTCACLVKEPCETFGFWRWRKLREDSMKVARVPGKNELINTFCFWVFNLLYHPVVFRCWCVSLRFVDSPTPALRTFNISSHVQKSKSETKALKMPAMPQYQTESVSRLEGQSQSQLINLILPFMNLSIMNSPQSTSISVCSLKGNK